MPHTRHAAPTKADRSHSEHGPDLIQPAEAGGPGDDPVPEKPTSGRTPNGRFAKGTSGNRGGRPPKPKQSLGVILRRVLDEEVPNNVPGQPPRITILEGLVRSLCVRGFKEPRIALSLLKLDAMSWDTAKEAADGEAETLVAEEEDALEAYLARELRRAQRPRSGEDER